MAKAGFTRKKVESMTLGEKLKKIRSEYRISLSEVSKQTKIQMKYLEYLENGEYEKLPADVYVRGFVRSYAHFLGTDELVLVKLYEQERRIQKNLKKEHFSEKSESAFSFPHFIVTPRLFIITGIVLLVFGGFIYLYKEFQSFAAVPQLTIVEPLNESVLSSREVYIRGNTEKDATITINGQPVLVRENGEFYEQVHLQSGLNTFAVSAINKFKKEKTVTISVQSNYEVQADAIPFEAPVKATDDIARVEAEKTSSKLIIKALDALVKIALKIDGEVVFEGDLSANDIKEFPLKSEYTISTSDAKHTLIGVNADEMMPVDTKAKEVTEKNVIVFPAEKIPEDETQDR